MYICAHASYTHTHTHTQCTHTYIKLNIKFNDRSSSFQCQRIFQVSAPVNCVCLHPNQAELIVGDQSGVIHLWDLRSDHNEQLVWVSVFYIWKFYIFKIKKFSKDKILRFLFDIFYLVYIEIFIIYIRNLSGIHKRDACKSNMIE